MRISFFLPLACLLFCSPLALAQEDPDKLVAEAYVQVDLGKFQEALTLYQKAYELSQDVDYLINIANCQEKLNQLERAITTF